VNDGSPLLECDELVAGYGRVEVVRDLDLAVRPGEVLALLGPNGAGKTTTLLTIAGLLRPLGGQVRVGGADMRPEDAVGANAAGVVLVPDDRALFPALTVAEHLTLAGRRSGSNPRDALDVFPALSSRWDVAAGALSGGEQQMLAVARALAQVPRVLLIDEMTMDLAPVIVEDLLPVVRRIAKDHDAAVLLVEQHVTLALEVADHAIVMVHGETALHGPAVDFAADPGSIERAYLGPR